MALNPFTGEEVEEIKLDPSPLIQVIAQISFPSQLSLSDEARFATVQTALSQQFNRIDRHKSLSFEISSNGEVSDKASGYWRLHSPDHKTHLSVGNDFATLDTTSYTSRDDFVGELRSVMDGLGQLDLINEVTRVGIRYVNQVGLESGTEVTDIAVPAFVGIATATEDRVELTHFQSHFIAKVDEFQVQARWGVKPEKIAWAPGIRLGEARSWVLDVDVVRTEPDGLDFKPEDLAGCLYQAAAIAYGFFRFATTDNFIAERSGQR